MTDILSATAFRHSRIYAEGWNAARSSHLKADDPAQVPSNPYVSEPERGRWLEGFTQALGKTDTSQV
jgi:hypothetical protein